jgi:glycerol kinase
VNVLAIDQGTSGTKALVVAPDGRVLGSGQVEVRPAYGDGGAVEVDPQALLDSVVEAGRAALRAAGEPVAAVGLANQGETVLAWEPATGRSLTPAIVWQDRRSAGVCERLAPAADRLAALTGLTLDPYFAAPKLLWLREQRTREGVVTTSDAWLVHALCGAFVTDASTASRTLLLDLDRAAWSDEALAVFGLAGEALPRVVDCAEIVGETTAFGEPVPLAGLVVDQQAALYAQRCLDPGTAKCTYGTGAFLLANAGTAAPRSRTGLTTSVAWRVAGATSYCLDGQVYTVASAVRWLADLGLIRDGRDLDAVGGAVADAGGVTFVPALAGLAAPHWRSDARGALRGLGLETTRGHLVRALVDGIASQVVDLARAAAADLGAPLDALRVDGGLTGSQLLMQAQADLLQAPVEVHRTPDATAVGAGAFARLGLEPRLGLAGALGPAEAPAAVYEPRIGADEAAARLGRHAALAAAL